MKLARAVNFEKSLIDFLPTNKYFRMILNLCVATAAVGLRGQQDAAAVGVSSPGQETTPREAPFSCKELLFPAHIEYSWLSH